MTKAIRLAPEIGVPFCKSVGYVDLRERANAACNTAVLLSEFGLDLIPTSEDEYVASSLATSYASDEGVTSKKVTSARLAQLRPASLVLVNDILTEFRPLLENRVDDIHARLFATG